MSTYEISKSSLLSLKAEILKKHQELAKVKSENEKKINIIKKSTPLEFKNKAHMNDNKQQTGETEAENEECQGLLKKSRLILEQKSALYERLRSGNLTEEERKQHKHLLVRFDKNIDRFSESDEEPDKYPDEIEDKHIDSEDDNISDPDEKWVDYIDCLGRTRKCLQKDLEHLKSNDNELKKIVDAKKRAAVENHPNSTVNVDSDVTDICEDDQTNDYNKNPTKSEAEMLSSDMRREMLREQWEKEEEHLRKKSDIHYQDILFGEARTHGVGYYGFSKNEEERSKQQEALNHLRKETEQKQQRAQELKMMREKQLAARIKAAKARRRARLGLPPEEEEEEPEPAVEPKISEEEKQKQVEVEKANGEKEKILEEARRKHLRPWDVGKDGVTKEHYEMTQEEWANMKRSERIDEFAPPSAYMNTKTKQNKTKYEEKIKKTTGVSATNSNSKKKQKTNDEWSRNKSSFSTKDQNDLPSYSDTDEMIDLTFSDRIYGSDNEYEINKSSYVERGRGTEIPPPLNCDYFGASSSKLPRASNKIDINESIEAGLKFLRTQIEKKNKRPKKYQTLS